MDTARISDLWQSTVDGVLQNRSTAIGVAAAAGVVTLTGVYFLSRSRRRKDLPTPPRATEIAAGGFKRNEVRNAFVDYSNSFAEAGVGIREKNKTSSLVDTFYNLVTDFYEWGWGESFHFSVPLPGKSEQTAETAYESRVAALCQLRPGMKCLDCGCGVGGPMRTIASVSGAEVIGVTINQYQVERTNYHNRRYGVDALCKAVHGSFMNLQFPENSFDAAYAIESTCHASDLNVVYGEVWRVLKPGSLFVTCEWLRTPLFDPQNPEHVKAIDDINYGNGLPSMRKTEDCLEAAKKTGFEVITHYDQALESKVCDPWYKRLEKTYGQARLVNRSVVNLLATLHLLPPALKLVHDMLVDTAAQGLVKAGQEGIFTPMYVIVLKKPKATTPP